MPMNPLSAIRHVDPSTAQLLRPPKPALEAPAAQTIPLEELEKAALEFNLNPVAKPELANSPFASTLGQLVKEVSAKQSAATDAVNGLLSGQSVPLHQAMIAMEEASVSFQLMVEVRNRLLDSYQELMRMQV